jgi:hypothetical protein
MNCIKCGREHQDYHFKTLQVQTLHVRDFGKNSRIQALGEFEEYSVCADCAEEKYNATVIVDATVKKLGLIWGGVMLLGLILAILYWNGEGVIRLAGLGMLVGGGLVLMGQLQSATRASRELLAKPQEDGLYSSAWACLLDCAPKKNDVNDISYIPVDEKTLARKNGDLMILYDLLPEIAIQAHKKIHGVEESE